MVPNGRDFFEQAAAFMREIEPVPPIELDSNLAIKVPDGAKIYADKKQLSALVCKKIDLFKIKFDKFEFHYDICSLDGKVSCLLQIVDDSNSGTKRRKALLNGDFSKVGISYSKLKNNTYCIYVLFAG